MFVPRFPKGLYAHELWCLVSRYSVVTFLRHCLEIVDVGRRRLVIKASVFLSLLFASIEDP